MQMTTRPRVLRRAEFHRLRTSYKYQQFIVFRGCETPDRGFEYCLPGPDSTLVWGNIKGATPYD